jgi:hypothetical protein
MAAGSVISKVVVAKFDLAIIICSMKRQFNALLVILAARVPVHHQIPRF